MKTITVLIVYDDEHGGVRTTREVEMLLRRAANLFSFWKKMDEVPNVIALRDENAVLAGTVTRS